MSCSSAGLPASFDRFDAAWQIDFEFRQDANHRPVPVSFFGKEYRTGTEFGPLNRDEILKLRRAPFDTARPLVTSYSIVAELSCFKVLGWPFPENVLCTYIETAAAINGLDIAGLLKKRPKLTEACDLFDIEHIVTRASKDVLYGTVLENENYTEEQERVIAEGNRADVLLEGRLFERLAPIINVPAALHRGRYAKGVADMEHRGIPISLPHLRELERQWQAIRMHFIKRDDDFNLYDDKGKFCEDRLADLADARGWSLGWRRTLTGKLEMKSKELGRQVKRHPELKNLQHLRDQIAEMRLGNFLNTVGADGFSRCSIMPFWTVTGRNQPSGKDKAFLLSLPSWLHGIIAPPQGFGAALFDWKAQEPGLAAAFSKDSALIADYESGDHHMMFAIRTGLAPPDATAETHRIARDNVKPISIGINYGMSKYGAAAQSKKSLAWAASAIASHNHAYPVFTQWQHDMSTQARFDERISTVFGWPMAVHAETRRGTLLNFPMQANGAEMMRLAAIAAYEAGIQICAPAHDAFWIMAPLSELTDTVEAMTKIMERAAFAVAGLHIPVEVAALVRWPQCLGDVRPAKAKGAAMWAEIQALLSSGELPKAAEAS
jgi:DNA polymerase-1